MGYAVSLSIPRCHIIDIFLLCNHSPQLHLSYDISPDLVPLYIIRAMASLTGFVEAGDSGTAALVAGEQQNVWNTTTNRELITPSSVFLGY